MPTASIRSNKVAPVRQDSAMWTEHHRARARNLVMSGNSRYRNASLKMAASTFHAIDYLEQAPVILIGACRAMPTRSYLDLAKIAGRFAVMVRRGVKLRDMLADYGIAFQFRALAASAVSVAAETAVLRLSAHPEVKPSALAQAIPKDHKIQAAWLRTIGEWIAHIERRRGEKAADASLPWAMARISEAVARAEVDITAVADFLLARPDGFVWEWTWDQARAAAERWHDEMQRQLPPRRGARRLIVEEWDTLAPTGMGRPDEIFDYSPWPLGMIVQGFLFSALDSPISLYDEGRAMHHCVGSYAHDVRTRRSRIYSIRFGERRVATVEFLEIGPKSRLVMAQLRGPRNAGVDTSVHHAAAQFSSIANRHYGRAGDAASPSSRPGPFSTIPPNYTLGLMPSNLTCG